MRFTLAFLLACAGCGDNRGPRLDEPSSGSRLHLVRHQYADGNEVVAQGRFFDSVLGAECSAARWSDGRMYCTPEAGPTVFVDASCQRSVGQVVRGEGLEAPRFFVRWFVLGEQRSPSRLYARGGQVGAPGAIYELRDGICFGPFVPGVAADYYALDEVGPARLHEAELIADDAFLLAALASEDGLVAPVGWIDRAREVPCRPEGEHEARCVPARADTATVFLDGQCTRPAVLTTEGVTGIGRFVEPSTRCTTYHPLGAAFDPAQVYLALGTECAAVDAPPGLVHPLDEALALPPITRARIDTGRRLHALVSSAGDRSLVDEELYDTLLGTVCRPGSVGGAVRCVPVTTTEARAYFVDEACSEEIVLARVPAGGCARPGFALDERGDVRRLGAPPARQVYTVTVGGTCVPAGAAELFVAGEPLVDELATVTRVIYDL